MDKHKATQYIAQYFQNKDLSELAIVRQTKSGMNRQFTVPESLTLQVLIFLSV